MSFWWSSPDSEGSGYSVLLLLLSDDSPLQEYLTELRLIIWLSVGELGIQLDYRRVNVCLVQLGAGLSLPLHLSSPLQSTLRWKQGSLSHHIPHSCITTEQFFAFCGGSRLQKSDDPPRLWFRSHLRKSSLTLYYKSLWLPHTGACAEMQSAINLSTCHQLWKIISHNEGVLFLYCYFKLKDPSTHKLSNI